MTGGREAEGTLGCRSRRIVDDCGARSGRLRMLVLLLVLLELGLLATDHLEQAVLCTRKKALVSHACTQKDGASPQPMFLWRVQESARVRKSAGIEDCAPTYHLSFLFLLQFLMKLSQRWSALVMRIGSCKDRTTSVADRARCAKCVAHGAAMLRPRSVSHVGGCSGRIVQIEMHTSSRSASL